MMEASGEDEVLVTVILLVGCGLKIKDRKKDRQKRPVWVNECLKQCSEEGHNNNIVLGRRLWDSAGYRRFLRMDSETFDVKCRVSFFLMLELF